MAFVNFRTKNMKREIVPRAEQHPQILAKADASEVFTFRAMVSSGIGEGGHNK
jgi:hypothetical protein